ncbi:hypothetical protein IC762_12335 [Bradyrhizobium genosp. L]|uniref:phage adaptor protein n=1 Tax=Bradyrhizobium genosp. L TaxID=83637 RepID=UPI0018A2D9B6|nr:hypothetical protein [Bradyrhizobium genosp. L]QPF87033.1 hypothetical protein IC762_12335 [Bradyrhizobium genosp. L]
MSYTYSSWLNALAIEIVVDPTDPNFLGILPSCIDYAEQRLYSELDLLNTVTRDSSALTSGSRNYTLPQNNGRFVVTNGLNLVTPAITTNPDSGTRTQLLPASRDYLDAVGGSPSFTGAPTNYAMITDQTLIVGPQWPDASYTIEVIGTIRPTPLSATNTTTYLTNYLPQLWFAASMVFMASYQQNFGAQADNPQMAVSWESQYQTLFKAIDVEENRKRYASGAWGSLSPAPIATPSR